MFLFAGERPEVEKIDPEKEKLAEAEMERRKLKGGYFLYK